MKTKFKFLSAILMALTILTITVQAGTVTAYSGYPLNGGTNSVPNATTNTPLTKWAFTTSSQNTLAVSFSCVGTNANNLSLVFDTSNDDSKFTTNVLRWVIACNGTSEVTASTNLSTMMPIWRLRSIENPGGTNAVTNILVTAYAKPGI